MSEIEPTRALPRLGPIALLSPEADLGLLAKGPEVPGFAVEIASAEWAPEGSFAARYQPYRVSGGVLTIPVEGALYPKLPYAFGFATGYSYIDMALERGLADPDVEAIALRIDSPGGHVAGNFELAEKIKAASSVKPVRAFADSAYSAAYSIASAADTLTLSRSGGAGSIGVLVAHMDVSKMLEQDGVKITLIYAGKHKVDGNPFEALPEDVRADFQARVDGTYEEFTTLVAANRGMPVEDVRATEARIYTARDAVAAGLADGVARLDDAMRDYREEFQAKRRATMAEEAAALAAATEAARAEGLAQGAAQAATQERERIKAILNSPEAEGRAGLARKLAFDTDMSAEQAESLLSASAKETAAQPTPDALAAAMAATGGGAGVVESAGADGDEDPETVRIAAIRALTQNAGLAGFKTVGG